MLAHQLHGRRPRHRLDAPHVRRARGLAEDVKEADLRRRAHVRATAELARVLALADLDHAHDLAVLLAEQRHRAQPLGLLERRRDRAHRIVRQHPLVHAILDIAQLLRAQALSVAEVEAKLVRTDIGAGLAHVGADALAQRRLQQMRGGVVASVACLAAWSTRAMTAHPLQLAALRRPPRAPGRRPGETRPPPARAVPVARPRSCPYPRPGRRPARRTATPRASPGTAAVRSPARRRARRRHPPRRHRSPRRSPRRARPSSCCSLGLIAREARLRSRSRRRTCSRPPAPRAGRRPLSPAPGARAARPRARCAAISSLEVALDREALLGQQFA